MFQDIPNIPRYGQTLDDVGKITKGDLVLAPAPHLKATFRAIRNHLAANAVGVTRDEVLAQQMINILFCKIYDENFTRKDESLCFRAEVNEPHEVIKRRIENLFARVKEWNRSVIDESDAITLDADSVAYVVGELQRYSLVEAPRDSVADAFEIFIGHALKGGQGQFFTPRNVVRMMVDMISPGPEDYVIEIKTQNLIQSTAA